MGNLLTPVSCLLYNTLVSLARESRLAARLLKRSGLKVVFAESCTAGLVSAALAGVAGVSEYHCGSAVTYRDRTKQGWLGIPAATLDRHGAVSAVVARRMAEGVLRRTPEADIAVAVTGHLGPDAPPRLDGLVFVALARRPSRGRKKMIVTVQRHRLKSDRRGPRQREAAQRALARLREALESE